MKLVISKTKAIFDKHIVRHRASYMIIYVATIIFFALIVAGMFIKMVNDRQRLKNEFSKTMDLHLTESSLLSERYYKLLLNSNIWKNDVLREYLKAELYSLSYSIDDNELRKYSTDFGPVDQYIFNTNGVSQCFGYDMRFLDNAYKSYRERMKRMNIKMNPPPYPAK